MPNDRPDKVIMLSSSPVKYMSTSASRIESGMDTATTMVGLTSLRKSARMIMASAAPIARETKILFTMRVM